MPEPPSSPVAAEGGSGGFDNRDDNVGPEYEVAALDNVTAGYEPMDDTGDILGIGEVSDDDAMQRPSGAADGDTGDAQYQVDDDMRHQPDVAAYGSGSRDMPEPQQRQQELRDFGEQSYGEIEQQGEVGGEEEEDEYEDPEEMIREFGRHPMMDRVQEALYNQLLQTYERVSEELRDKDADVKK